MYRYDTYSYMMSNVHLDTIIIAIPIDIQNHLSPYAMKYASYEVLKLESTFSPLTYGEKKNAVG